MPKIDLISLIIILNRKKQGTFLWKDVNFEIIMVDGK